MPEKLYWDIKRGKKVTMLSDNFYCSQCGFEEFDFIFNPDYASGESDKKYRRVCKNCGSAVYVEKNLSKEVENYIPYEEYKLMNEEAKEEIKNPPKEESKDPLPKEERSRRAKKAWETRKKNQEKKKENSVEHLKKKKA